MQVVGSGGTSALHPAHGRESATPARRFLEALRRLVAEPLHEAGAGGLETGGGVRRWVGGWVGGVGWVGGSQSWELEADVF